MATSFNLPETVEGLAPAAKKAADSEDKLSSSTEGVGKAAEETTSKIRNLINLLSELGAIIPIGAVIKFTADLLQMGAAAERAAVTLNTLSHDKADEYISKISGATSGLIDNTNAAALAAELLSLNLAKTSFQVAEVARVATTLGAAFSNMGAKEATQEFVDMLGSMSTDQLKDFGLSINEVTSKIQELKQADADLSDQQAFANAVMDISEQKSKQVSKAVADDAAVLERAKTDWDNLGESVGKFLSHEIVVPILRATQSIDDHAKAVQKQHEAIALASSSVEDYIGRMRTANPTLYDGREGIELLTREYVKFTKAANEAGEADLDNVRITRESLAAAYNAAEAQQKVDDRYVQLSKDIVQYNQEIERQTHLELGIMSNVDGITAALQKQGGAYQVADSFLKQFGFSESEQLSMTRALGLETGQLTVKQIEQGKGYEQMTNLLKAGKIDIGEWAKGMENISKATDPAKAVTDEFMKAIPPAELDLVNAGIITRAQALDDVAKAAEGTTKSEQDIGKELDEINKIKGNVNMNDQQVKDAYNNLIAVQQKIDYLQTVGTINVKVNFETSVSGPGASFVNQKPE